MNEVNYSNVPYQITKQVVKSGLFLMLALLLINCKDSAKRDSIQEETHTPKNEVLPTGSTIETRFPTLEGYKRASIDSSSFAFYLRSLPLKPATSEVKYFNGSSKENNDVYCGVVDLPIGTKDLHQCADAVIRLRAEYLWKIGAYDRISFDLTNGDKIAYKKWMNGYRVLVNGNTTKWELKTEPSNDHKDLWEYLEFIFTYAGTASLDRELSSSSIDQASIGDVLIQGGHPGHAVIIVDKITAKETDESLYLLAQSYMPAQETQILVNNSQQDISPWYRFTGPVIATPEWTFDTDDLHTFGR